MVKLLYPVNINFNGSILLIYTIGNIAQLTAVLCKANNIML